MTKPDLREMLNDLLSNFENYYFECEALKFLLRHAEELGLPSWPCADWEQKLEELKADPVARQPSRAIFDELREKVKSAIDDESALQVLSRIPIKGRPN